MEADAAGVAYDDGADLQELEADSVRLSPGHRGAPQPQPADRRDQRIGERREDQTELVGPPLVAAGAVGKEGQLLLLDAVLHLAAGVVEALVERLRLAFEVGDDVARVGSLGPMLEARDDAAFLVPCLSALRIHTLGVDCVRKMAGQSILHIVCVCINRIGTPCSSSSPHSSDRRTRAASRPSSHRRPRRAPSPSPPGR